MHHRPLLASLLPLLLGACSLLRPTPVTATIKGMGPNGKLQIDVTAAKDVPVICVVVTRGVADDSSRCESTRTDANGHATLEVDPITADETTEVTITAGQSGRTTTTTVSLKNAPPMFSANVPGYFNVIGRSCSGKVVYVPDLSVSVVGDCTGGPASSWHATVPSAKVHLSDLDEKAKGDLEAIPVEVTLKDGNKLTGKVIASKEDRRKELLEAIKTGKALTGEDKEPFANAAIVFPEKGTPLLAGNPAATVGGIHYYATVAWQARKQTMKCTYHDKAGKVLEGEGDYMDGAVKLLDRHTQKVVADTLLRAEGIPCDAKQKLSEDATEAKTSYAWYSDDALEKWVVAKVAAEKH